MGGEGGFQGRYLMSSRDKNDVRVRTKESRTPVCIQKGSPSSFFAEEWDAGCDPFRKGGNNSTKPQVSLKSWAEVLHRFASIQYMKATN